MGHSPGNVIKVLQELLWAADYDHSLKEEVDFTALTINMPISDPT